jgi:hypothetical protein
MSAENPNNPQQPDPQPYSQQPDPQPYSQQPYPQPYPQSPQPPKKKRRWPLIIGIIVGALVLCGAIGSALSHGSTTTATTSDTTTSSTTSSSSSTTSAPSKPLTWQTVKTFKGTGSEKTDTFTVPDTWKLTWTCDPASFQSIQQYNVIAIVEDSSGALVDSGVNALCKAGTTSGSTNVTSGGTVRLDITSEGDWTFNIQEQK